MKGVFILFALILFAFGQLNAQASSLLWKISGNGLSQASYIYGTIHIICPQDFVMSNKVKTTFAETEQLYLELDFDDPQIMQEMMQLSMLPNGKTAKDYLTSEEYSLLDTKFKNALGTGMDQLQSMKPLMLLSMSYMALLKCHPISFENVFATMAKEENKEVLGLETVEYQMSVFDAIPVAEQFKMIVSILEQEDKAIDEFNTLVRIYNEENIKGMLKLMKNDSEWNLKKYSDKLVNNRNNEWAEKFDGIAKEKSTFFAVGAGHLAGEKGWLNLLKNKGYKVEPIKQ